MCKRCGGKTEDWRQIAVSFCQNSNSEYMIFIPVEGGYNEEGAYIEGTETPREDMSFVIMF